MRCKRPKISVTFLGIFLGIFLCVSSLEMLHAQGRRGLGTSLTLQYGQIAKHTDAFTTPVRGMTRGLVWQFERQSFGREKWQAMMGYPTYGLLLSYQDFGDPQLFGQGIGVAPYMHFSFAHTRWANLFFRGAVGFSYITRPYHVRDNPTNVAIGSYLNNFTSAILGIEVPIHKRWRLRPAVSFTHYSNAATQMPNLGVNTIVYQLEVLHLWNAVDKKDFLTATWLDKRKKEVFGEVLFGVGMRESKALGGRKYGLARTQLNLGFWLTRNHRLRGHFGVLWDRLRREVLDNQQYPFSARARAAQARRYMFAVSDEILLGRVSFMAEFGVYLNNTESQTWYIMPSLRYYFRNNYTHRIRPFISLGLNSYQFVASFAVLQVGTSF